MNIGLLFPFRNPPRWRKPFPQFYAEQLRQTQIAETLGYDTIWLTEHHFAEDGYSPSLLPIAGAIAGVGSIQRMKAVRWGIATNIVWAWILTIPMSAVIAALSFTILHVIAGA